MSEINPRRKCHRRYDIVHPDPNSKIAQKTSLNTVKYSETDGHGCAMLQEAARRRRSLADDTADMVEECLSRTSSRLSLLIGMHPPSPRMLSSSPPPYLWTHHHHDIRHQCHASSPSSPPRTTAATKEVETRTSRSPRKESSYFPRAPPTPPRDSPLPTSSSIHAGAAYRALGEAEAWLSSHRLSSSFTIPQIPRTPGASVVSQTSNSTHHLAGTVKFIPPISAPTDLTSSAPVCGQLEDQSLEGTCASIDSIQRSIAGLLSDMRVQEEMLGRARLRAEAVSLSATV